MKTSFLKIAAVALLATSVSSGIAQVENAKTAGESVEQVNTESQEEMKKFKQKSKDQISENDKKITELKELANSKAEEAKVEYDKSVAALSQKNQALKEKVDSYKGASKEQWESFKSEINLELKELDQSLSALAKK